jgi:TctA family transporter
VISNTMVTDKNMKSITQQMTVMFVFQAAVIAIIFLLMFGNCWCIQVVLCGAKRHRCNFLDVCWGMLVTGMIILSFSMNFGFLGLNN